MTKEQFKILAKKSKKELIKNGFKQWAEPNNGFCLMLIPGSLYKSIPLGFKIVGLGGKPEKFSKDTDNDTRFGCLPYGIIVKQ